MQNDKTRYGMTMTNKGRRVNRKCLVTSSSIRRKLEEEEDEDEDDELLTLLVNA